MHCNWRRGLVLWNYIGVFQTSTYQHTQVYICTSMYIQCSMTTVHCNWRGGLVLWNDFAMFGYFTIIHILAYYHILPWLCTATGEEDWFSEMTVERPQLLFPPLSAVSTCSNQQCNDVTISRRLFCTFLYFLGNFFTPFPTPVCGLNMVHPTMQQGTFWMLVFWLLGALFFFTPPLSQPNLRL